MKDKRKLGFTLLELISTMAIATIIGISLLNLSIGIIKNYVLSAEKVILLDKIDNAMLNLEVLFNSNGISNINCNVNIEGSLGNNLFVSYYEDVNSEDRKDKIVYLKGDRLMVKTIKYSNGVISKNDNVLLYNVHTFSVHEKDKLIYYSIIMKSGEIRVRCI